MKRIISLVFAMLFVISILGCSNEPSTNSDTSVAAQSTETSDTSSNSDEKVFKIGFQDLGLNDVTFDARWANYQYMCSVAGMEAVQQLVELTPEGFIDGTEKLIQAGCDGLVIWPIAESILPKIAAMCDEAGVYYVLSHRTIQDDEIRALCESSPYYLGCVVEDEDQASYDLAKYLYEQGTRTIALITEPISDTMSMTRETGVLRAADEYGMEVVGTARGLSQGAEVTKAISSFISAYPELDTVILTGLTTPGQVDGSISAIMQAGLTSDDIKLAACDFVEGAQTAMEEGWMGVVYGGQHVPNGVFSTALVIDALQNGGRFSEKPLELTIDLTWVYSAEDYNDYWKYIAGDIPIFTAEELNEKVLLSGNPDLTVDDLIELASNYSLEDVRERHKDIESIPGYSVDGYTG